jgi:tetratricopeptide (TPR) repeat protein
MRSLLVAGLLVGLASGLAPPTSARGQSARLPADEDASTAAAVSIGAAQHLFYVGHYEEAAAMALRLRRDTPDDLPAYELRTSALHFQIKRQLGDGKDRQEALKQCQPCPDLMAEMKADTTRAQAIARARLKADPNDTNALFFLGKIDLNHVWLYLGTLGQRTGWGEYWEARHSLDAVLKLDPQHVRARVARAWIDYIVDTRVPWALRWVLGGGSKKRALRVAREAATADTDFYAKTEARFALWEMLVREEDYEEALGVAEGLASDFPENRELVRFIQAHQSRAAR